MVEYGKKTSGFIENLTSAQQAELQAATRAAAEAAAQHGKGSSEHKAALAELEEVKSRYNVTGWPT